MAGEIRLRNMTSVYLVAKDKVLCLFRVGSRVADKMYIGSAGGHFEENELNDPKKCALRELHEELGLTPQDITPLQLRYITLRLKNGEIRQNYYFFASLLKDQPLSSTEGTLHWVDFKDVQALNMPVSAKQMILHYLKEGQFTSHIYSGITENDGTRFVVMKEFE